jgi:hypothetical protein
MYRTPAKIVSKLFSFLGGVVVTLLVVAAIAVPCAISWALSSTNATADISHDVSLRLASPDYRKIAFLINSNSGSERYVIVEMLTAGIISTTKYELIADRCKRRIFRSKIYDPDLRIDLHENIEWSSDSSLLVLTIDAQSEPFKWAYDFQTDHEVVNPDRIEALWQERNRITLEN